LLSQAKQYGLTIIEKTKGKTPRSIYFAEKRGEPTKYNVIRKTIHFHQDTSEGEFERFI